MINKITSFTLILLINIQVSLYANQSSHKIEYLVNEKIITNYDIAQHFAINSILEMIQITDETKDFFYKKTVNQLINLKLKQIKIDEYNVLIEEEQKDYYEDYFFKSKNLDKKKVFEIIKLNNLDIKILREIINTSIAWEKLTSGLFFRTISISENEITELINKDASLSKEAAKRMVVNRQIALKSEKFLRDLKSETNIEKR